VKLFFIDTFTDVRRSGTFVIDICVAEWSHKFNCFTSRFLRYRLFKEDKTDLLTSFVTGKTTVMALEISLVNSG